MIRSRTRGKTFAEASELHFEGKPRALRLWDEDILPRQWKTIRVDHIRSLSSPLRSRFPDYVEQTLSFAAKLDGLEIGNIVTVPGEIALHPSVLPLALEAIPTLDLKGAVEALQTMAGHEMRIEGGSYYGPELLGLTEALPDDLAPLVVVDASGRVRDAYRVWEVERGDLVRLPSAGNLYLKVNLHHWHRASGKDELADPAALAEISSAIAQAFTRDPKGEWLVIASKGGLNDLREAISTQKHPLGEGQLHWLNWGRHRSTNAHKDVENVVIVGLNRYRPTDYQGLALAASGLSIRATDYPDTALLGVGELKHNLLQAACRGSLRKANRGLAAPCNVFLIGKITEAETLLDQVFPGCNYVAWNAQVGLMDQRVAAAIEWVRNARERNPGSALRKQDLREALGIGPQDLTRVINDEAFVAFLEREGLETTTRAIRRNRDTFELQDTNG